MPVRPSHSRRRAGALSGLACALLAAAALSGCASVSDTISPAFVDPARYELYDCKQLETERKSIATRLDQLQRSMAKAETATGGTVIAEMVYRNDYISARGQQKLADETWRRNKCVESPPTAAAPGAAAPVASMPAAAAPGRKAAPAGKSGSAVH